MKVCTRCNTVKPLEAFYKNASKPSGRQIYCKICAAAHKKEWISSNRDKVKWNRLWSNYRLRRQDFEKKLSDQNNACSCCKKVFTSTPHVDHDHSCCNGTISCGKCVRGLLCPKCNHLLGLLETNRALFTELESYISNHAPTV